MVRYGVVMIRGERRSGEALVTVDGAVLDWRSSLTVRNASPTARRVVTAGRSGPDHETTFLLAVDRPGAPSGAAGGSSEACWLRSSRTAARSPLAMSRCLRELT